MNRQRTIAAVLVVACLAGAAGLFAARQTAPAAPAAPASAAAKGALSELKALSLPDLGGVSQPLAQWQGKVLVVNFWATWCPPCRKEIPAFSTLSRKYAGQGVQFVGISIDSAENVREFQQAQQVAYPLLIASPAVVQLTEELGNASQGLPFTVILNAAGNIDSVKLGALSEDELDRRLAALSRR